MSDLIERSAALRVIFDSVGRPATEIYQKVRELPAAETCPHYIRNVHDRGDDSFCRKYVCEIGEEKA